MGHWGTRDYSRLMRVRPHLPAFKRLLLILPVLMVASTACLVQPQGLAASPSPGAQGASRLPQLLQQLQAGGSALELFDASPTPSAVAATGTQAQVLGVQDSPLKTPTPAGTFNGGTQSTASPTATPHLLTPTPTPRPALPTATPIPAVTITPNVGP